MNKDNKIQMLTEPLSQLSIVAHTSNGIKSLTQTNNIILLSFLWFKNVCKQWKQVKIVCISICSSCKYQTATEQEKYREIEKKRICLQLKTFEK